MSLFIKLNARRAAGILLTGLTLFVSPTFAQEAAELGETGTDPRDFAPKFMPYYRFTELENGLENYNLNLFDLFAFDKKFAMTYEIPVGYKNDVSGTALRNPDGTCGPGGIPPMEGMPPISPGGTEGDCEETGVGDMNLRFMYSTDWDALGGDWLVGVQIDLPTATDDLLGSEQVKIGPMFAYVRDIPAWPGPGAFFALMNFYFFDAFGEDDRGDTSLYVGRWFVMLPLSEPDGSFWGGWYTLPEFQPIYDFEEDHFSFWVGPEFGKMLAPGQIAYFKPGWGYDPDEDEGDREFTFEIGYRYFID
jgi:hypothetical protein